MATSTLSPADFRHHVIEWVRIEGGYLDGLMLELDPRLNVIIGIRGAGKSTVIEAIRSTLNAPIVGVLAADQQDLLASNLKGATVQVGLRTKHGARYVVTRTFGEPPRVQDETGAIVDVSLDGDLFQVRVLGQNEIVATAKSPAARLALIDSFLDDRGQKHHDAISATLRALRENALEILKAAREIADHRALVEDLPTLDAVLAELARNTPAGAEIGGFETHANERAALEDATARISSVTSDLDGWFADVERRVAGTDSGDRSEVGAADDLRALAEALGVARDAVREGAARAQAAVGEKARATRAALEREEERLGAHFGARPDGAAAARERGRLEARRAELRLVARRIEGAERRRGALFTRRVGLLGALGKQRHDLFVARVGVGADLNGAIGDQVRVEIEESGGREAYEALLSEIVKRSVSDAFIRKVAAGLPPEALAAAVLADDPTPIEAIDESKTGRAERARKLIDLIRASGRVFELEIVGSEDVVHLKIWHHGVEKRPGSPGQRAAAILPILFHRAAGPLLFDQPEDHLDGTYIYRVLAARLRAAVERQQVIVVTHHANIPVIGGAHRVAYVESTGDHGRIGAAGSLDETSRLIEEVCEGGDDALPRRGERYGYEIKRPPTP